MGERWNMVTDPDENGVSREQAVIGYETFIPTFDIFESSYSYVKHDTFMIFVEVRDLSELDTSSKLSTCFDEGDNPAKDPGRCSSMGRACMKGDDGYKCRCHYPFIEENDGTCTCPPGYEFNPEAEEQEAERLTCFSLCDFDETNPCTADEVCSQSDSGVECKNLSASFESEKLKTNNFNADVFNDENPDDYFDDEIYFTSFQMGVSIALSVMGTLIAIGIIYGVIQYRRMVKLRKLTHELTMQSIQRNQTLPPTYAPHSHKNSAFNDI